MRDGDGIQRPEPASIAIPGGLIKALSTPTSADEVAERVAQASSDQTKILIVGGQTRLHWANAAHDISNGLSICGLSGVDEFEPEEGVLHAAAGTRISEIQELVNQEGWELALDPPGLNSTVGGTIASAAVGPRAQGLGRVADVILGLDMVGADGVKSKCGGRVVKNVTGYDMAKLYCGSFGSLGVIVGAWLRLRPLIDRREAYVARVETTQENFERCRGIGRRQSVRALVWSEGLGEGFSDVVIELGGVAELVEEDRRALAEVLEIEKIPTSRVDRLRDERAEVGPAPVFFRSRVRGSRLFEFSRRVADVGFQMSIDLGCGAMHARGVFDQSEGALGIRRLANEAGGTVFFEKLPEALRDKIDVFDEVGDGASLASTLKTRFDPLAVLNPGRFAGRL